MSQSQRQINHNRALSPTGLGFCSTTASSVSTDGKTGGLPNFSISLRSLSADALIGIPVQWKPKGKRTFAPVNLWYAAANSSLEREKAWPKCKYPFMYGKGKVPKNFWASLGGWSLASALKT
ncbi:hypothetical protein HanHA300_Chr11g0404991 [Helianthus annuus]|nr:hypothetical protein HanHA300_Chr11g0404991 [Helianthus annuus]KAJ0517700.1 hypothetical protein HanHA89_Chr11g0428681 [Helianthus annuus]KAJ0685716.1 hypothetical protein HanLR1_Chr11g0406171 [Helianthus annuus]